MRPISIPSYIQKFWNLDRHAEATFEETRQAYARLAKGSQIPEVSIVMPAYNEEESLVQTLASLCNNETNRAVEIIVVNNNSKDKTEELAKRCGVTCIFQSIQGIAPTRNMGLSSARGKYILNADADTLYPKDWIEEMVKPLESKKVAITYGTFSFIPIGSTGRLTYFFYEYFADLTRWLNKFLKDESVNVYGFNSGFRRVEGLEVDGFNFPKGAGEDGWLAMKLKNKGFGRLHLVNKPKALVWTTDRRIQIDGGLWKGIYKRLKRTILRR